MAKNIVIIIPGYKNAQWYEKNLASVFAQNYTNYRVIYTDDNSPDNTGNLVEEYTYKSKQNNIQLIKNPQRKGAMENIYDMVLSCQDSEVVVCLDADDWFAHPNVLTKVNEVYNASDIWMSYGSYIDFPSNTRGCAKPYEKNIIDSNNYRYVPWRASHLRTFYAGLFKKIKKEDMMYEGKFYESAWDLSIMLPLLEMCAGKFAYIDDILYVYNNQNPISDYKIKASQQAMFDGHIRRRPKYNKLERLF